jgi:hypothetical protein
MTSNLFDHLAESEDLHSPRSGSRRPIDILGMLTDRNPNGLYLP